MNKDVCTERAGVLELKDGVPAANFISIEQDDDN